MRTLYASILTALWLAVLIFRVKSGFALIETLPAASVIGAWFAVYGYRAGYTMFWMTSMVMLVLLGLMMPFMLIFALAAFLSGDPSQLHQLIGVIVAIFILCVTHVSGMKILRLSTIPVHMTP